MSASRNGESTLLRKHWVGTEASVRRKAMLITRARRITSTPQNYEEKTSANGGPKLQTNSQLGHVG